MTTNIDKMREFLFFWLGSLGNRFKDQSQTYKISVSTLQNSTAYTITTTRGIFEYISSASATINEILTGLQTEIDNSGEFTTDLTADVLTIIDENGIYFGCEISDNLSCSNGNGVIVIEGYNNAQKDDELANFKPTYPFFTFRISTAERTAQDVKWETNDTYRLHQTLNVDVNVYDDVDHISIMNYISLGLKFEDIRQKMSDLNTGLIGNIPDIVDLSGILGGRSEKRANANFRFGTVTTIENSGIAGLVTDPIEHVVIDAKTTSYKDVYENTITVDKENP